MKDIYKNDFLDLPPENNFGLLIMTEDVEKSFFDIIVQLKEIDPDAYYKVLKELGHDDEQET